MKGIYGVVVLSLHFLASDNFWVMSQEAPAAKKPAGKQAKTASKKTPGKTSKPGKKKWYASQKNLYVSPLKILKHENWGETWVFLLTGISLLPVRLSCLWRRLVWGVLMFHLRLQTNDIIHRYIQTSRRHEGCAYAKPSMRRGLLHSEGEWQCVCHSMLQHKIDPGYSWLFIQRSTDLTWNRV